MFFPQFLFILTSYLFNMAGNNHSDKRLEIYLAEHTSLRDELKRNFDIQIKIYGILVPALGIAYGLIFKTGVYDLILILPFIFLPLGFRFQHSNYGVKLLGEYLEYIDDEIRKITGDDNWIGWQTYWNKRHYKWISFFWDGLAKWLLFIAIPFGIALIYLCRSNLPIFSGNMQITSYFNYDFNYMLGGIYIFAIFGSIISCYYMDLMDKKRKNEFELKKTVIVFQYGSNCLESEINSSKRLNGKAKFLDVAKTIERYRLCFNVYSKGRDGGAADIVRSDKNEHVWGVLYEVPIDLLSRYTKPFDTKSLDEIEGEGSNYNRYWIPVERPKRQKLIALTYIVRDEKKKETQTNTDYAKLIISGLKEHKKEGIPEEYINKIKKEIRKNNPDINIESF